MRVLCNSSLNIVNIDNEFKLISKGVKIILKTCSSIPPQHLHVEGPEKISTCLKEQRLKISKIRNNNIP